MNGNTVYAKTPAGQQEIGERKAGLDIRQRRLLILVDGHRSADELARLSGLPDVPALLEGLQAKGRVAPSRALAGPAPPAASPAAAVPAPAAPVGDQRQRRRPAAHAGNELPGPWAVALA